MEQILVTMLHFNHSRSLLRHLLFDSLAGTLSFLSKKYRYVVLFLLRGVFYGSTQADAGFTRYRWFAC